MIERARRLLSVEGKSARAQRLIPACFVIGSIVSLQFGSGYAATLFDEIGSSGATTLRLGLGALIMLTLVRPKLGRWNRQQWTTVGLFGLTFGLMNGLFYEALARIPFGIALAIEFLGPLGLAAALSRRFKDLMWVACALTGVLLIGLQNADTGQLNVAGFMFAALAGLAWAAYIVMGARTAAAVPGREGLAVALAVGALINAPFGISHAGSALFSPTILLAGLVVAVFSSVLPYTLELQALRTMPKKTFSILLALEPAAAVAVGAIMLNQHLGIFTIAAIGLVVLAGIGATSSSPDQPRRRGRRKRQPSEEVGDIALN